ncbi:MAG: hypothetical protein LBJ12_09440 [Oscillospiraceae bacterium]|jgi:hypothetical protein|nr:hypothetical protein [Oscillospiraceae bacterium]
MLDLTSLGNILQGLYDFLNENFNLHIDFSDSQLNILQQFGEVLRTFVSMIVNADL